jgi:hypothetical protein
VTQENAARADEGAGAAADLTTQAATVQEHVTRLRSLVVPAGGGQPRPASGPRPAAPPPRLATRPKPALPAPRIPMPGDDAEDRHFRDF